MKGLVGFPSSVLMGGKRGHGSQEGGREALCAMEESLRWIEMEMGEGGGERRGSCKGKAKERGQAWHLELG